MNTWKYLHNFTSNWLVATRCIRLLASVNFSALSGTVVCFHPTRAFEQTQSSSLLAIKCFEFWLAMGELFRVSQSACTMKTFSAHFTFQDSPR